MWKRINLFFTVGVVVWRDDGHETTVKENNSDGWSSDGLVLWLRSGQNRDVTEWWGEWPRLRWHFYSSRGWELDDPGRMTGGGGTDSMLQFQLERKGDGMKHCRNMKWKQQARLGSMERKAWHGAAVSVKSTGGETALGREKGWYNASWDNGNLTLPKNKKNTRNRSSCYKCTTVNREMFVGQKPINIYL
jgi:hypothetical protein